MNRSGINRLIGQATHFIGQQGFHLPRFAHWNRDAWRRLQSRAGEIFEAQLVSDYPAYLREVLPSGK